MIIFTIGHSTRTLHEFLEILKKYKINQLIDIRTMPRSRHNPQFNMNTFAKFLRNRKINYRHMKGLTGFRHAKKDSINSVFYNKSFRGFADYMQTYKFKKNLKKLISYAKKKRIVLMCAEILPFRCHRSLIGDALVAKHIVVKDIYNLNSVKNHEIRDFAKIRKDRSVYYPKMNQNL